MKQRIMAASTAINKVIENIGAVLLFIVTTLTFSGVVARYVFGSPIVWLYETTLVMFSWLIFLGVSIAFKKSEHTHLELIYHKLPLKTAKICRLIVNIIVIVFLAVVVYYGVIIVRNTSTQSYNTIRLSTAWFYIPFPICAAVSLFHAFAAYISGGQFIRGDE